MISESRVNGSGRGIVLGPVEVLAITLLTAPRSGRETRERLESAALDLEKTVRVPGAMQRARQQSRQRISSDL